MFVTKLVLRWHKDVLVSIGYPVMVFSKIVELLKSKVAGMVSIRFLFRMPDSIQ